MARDSYTVGQYLVDRLHELGVRHLFAVPGPHCAGWLHHYVESGSALQRFGTTNAVNAGYAADGYARVNGLGAVCVPYSVGAYSVLPSVAGAFAERVPVVIVNGAPPEQRARMGTPEGPRRPVVGDRDANLRAYEDVTCAAEQVVDPERAPEQIDRVLRTCLDASRPVYVEPRADVYDRPCPPPSRPLSRAADRSGAGRPVEEPAERIADRLHAADSVVVWGGIELQRYDLTAPFDALVRALDAPYVTSLLGKGLLPEHHSHFAGVVAPPDSPPAVRTLVEDADYVLGLGVGAPYDPPPALATDTGAATFVRRDGLAHGPRPGSDGSAASSGDDAVDLRSLLFRLWTNVADGLSSFGGTARAGRTREAAATARPSMSTDPDARPTYQGFYDLIPEYVGDDTLLMSGVGLDRFGAFSLPVHSPSGFICQAAYRDAGYVTPAAIGAELGGDYDRVMVFVGDGGFQMTVQCLGTMAEQGLDPIIFVLNNGVYGAEQRRTDPAPFEDDDAFHPQALLQHWHYRKLPDAMGGKGWRVETYGQLRSAVEEAAKYTGGPLLIDVRLRQKSLPALATETLDPAEHSLDLAAEAVLPNSS